MDGLQIVRPIQFLKTLSTVFCFDCLYILYSKYGSNCNNKKITSQELIPL